MHLKPIFSISVLGVVSRGGPVGIQFILFRRKQTPLLALERLLSPSFHPRHNWQECF